MEIKKKKMDLLYEAMVLGICAEKRDWENDDDDKGRLDIYGVNVE